MCSPSLYRIGTKVRPGDVLVFVTLPNRFYLGDLLLIVDEETGITLGDKQHTYVLKYLQWEGWFWVDLDRRRLHELGRGGVIRGIHHSLV